MDDISTYNSIYPTHSLWILDPEIGIVQPEPSFKKRESVGLLANIFFVGGKVLEMQQNIPYGRFLAATESRGGRVRVASLCYGGLRGSRSS